MTVRTDPCTAIAHPNIALCKYWGKRATDTAQGRALNLPATPSLSLTVAPFHTRTTVTCGVGAAEEAVTLNGQPADEGTVKKIRRVLALIEPDARWRVESQNSFPTAAGLASSSSGFAALVVAGAAAAGKDLSTAQLAVIARQGSGSATRSLYGGWAEWPLGTLADGSDSHGLPVAPMDHWDLKMLVAIVASGPKEVSSTDGMGHSAATSPYHAAWVASAPADVEAAHHAVLRRDLFTLGGIMERSTLRMHACMLAADPPLRYWQAGTLAAIARVEDLRRQGCTCFYTMDAGPNVKVLCAAQDAEVVRRHLLSVAERVEVLSPGPGARLL